MGNWCFGSSGQDDVTPLQHTPPPEPNSAPQTPRQEIPRRTFFPIGGGEDRSLPSSSQRRGRPRPSSTQQRDLPHQSAPEPPPPYFPDQPEAGPSGSGRGGPRSEERAKNEQDQLLTAKRLSLLQHIPTDTYSPGEKRDKECIICMIDFEEGERIRTLPCLHTYHLACIDDWLLRSFTCATCMEPVDSALLASFYPGDAGASLADLGTSPAAAVAPGADPAPDPSPHPPLSDDLDIKLDDSHDE